MALRFLLPGDLQHHQTPIGKAAELLALGLIVGVFSVALSFLWAGYAYKASDFIQYFGAESAWGRRQGPLSFRFVFIDIGERTCRQWAKKDYDELCAALPRFPHAELAKIFRSLKTAKPKLVIIDIDLRTEKAGSSPFVPDDKLFTDEERDIRKSVLAMKDTAFAVAQPLIRQPKEFQKQHYDFRLVATILHGLEKENKNLRFGQVEQDVGDDGVIRRFFATVQVAHRDSVLNPNTTDSQFVQHLALRVCELVKDDKLCGRERAHPAQSTAATLQFGSLPVNSKDRVQFLYLLPQDVTRLADFGVEVLEARSLLATSFDKSALENAVVIFGSTARGRGDYHITPLDVRGGETAGLVILANEVVAALQDRWLVNPHWFAIMIEKLALIIFSTAVVFFGFWYLYFRTRRDDGIVQRPSAKILSLLFVFAHFMVVVLITVALNAVIMWFISMYSFKTGELVDPVTPVVAAILDIVVDVCAMIKQKAASWADQWQSTVAKSLW